MFTNALIAPHDITALIRDTEVHERALFSLAPPPVPSKAQVQQLTSSFTGSAGSATKPSISSATSRAPKPQTAVAAVLGGDLFRRIRSAGVQSHSYGSTMAKEKGDLDVDVLLEGAEKLCNVYPISNANERIAQMRERYEQLATNIAHYEDRVARNAMQLDTMYQRKGYERIDVDEEDITAEPIITHAPIMTKEDLVNEEQEIRELEQRKRGLEDRVTGMERDLGGLMR